MKILNKKELLEKIELLEKKIKDKDQMILDFKRLLLSRSTLKKYSKSFKVAKYRSKCCVIDNIKFKSIKEAKRYLVHKNDKAKGLIKDYFLQPKYLLVKKNDKNRAVTYAADFKVIKNDNSEVIEDVKGYKTKDYIIKKKLMKEIYNIDVIEV
jgi:hypothetical protein